MVKYDVNMYSILQGNEQHLQRMLVTTPCSDSWSATPLLTFQSAPSSHPQKTLVQTNFDQHKF